MEEGGSALAVSEVELGGSGGALFSVDVAEHDAIVALGKGFSNAEAHALGGASDDGRVHGLSAEVALNMKWDVMEES